MTIIRNYVGSVSGKGGVGKTTVIGNEAELMAVEGYDTGLLDLDIKNPKVHKFFGIESKPDTKGLKGKLKPVILESGLKVHSIGFIVPDREYMRIRPEEVRRYVIQCFVAVDWGKKLDYMFIDMPPTTSMEHLTIEPVLRKRGCVIITGISEDAMAVTDCNRTISLYLKERIPIIGVVENFSGQLSDCCDHTVHCGNCGKLQHAFPVGAIQDLAVERDVRFLGCLPLNPAYNTDNIRKRKLYKEQQVFQNIKANLPELTFIQHFADNMKGLFSKEKSGGAA